MSAALSSELRGRFREYIEEGLSGRAAAAQLKLSSATGVRWLRKLRETGKIAPDVQGRARVMASSQRTRGFLKNWLRRTATSLCPNSQEPLRPLPALSPIPHPSDGSCASLSIRTKKVTGRNRKAARACKASTARLVPTPYPHYANTSRQACVYCFSGHCYAIPCQPADETSVKTNLTRLRGRSLRGTRLEMNAPFGAWGTQTFIAGLTHDSLIAPWVIKGAMDGEAFAAYIREVLAPELRAGTVVICDNLATHRNKDAVQALKDIGFWFLYLPPYSPDLNRIEMAFSKLKTHLRRIAARTFDQMFDALAEICGLFTPQECWNYFCEAGYGSG